MGLSVRDADVSRLTPAAPAASRTAVQSIAEQATGGSVSAEAFAKLLAPRIREYDTLMAAWLGRIAAP